MDTDDVLALCTGLPGAVEDYPFGDDVAVFKVGGKMFAIVSLVDEPGRVTLKCDPEWALEPYFATRSTLRGGTLMLVERHLYGPTFHVLLRLANRLRALQSGNLRTYLLYVFATLLVLLVLSR